MCWAMQCLKFLACEIFHKHFQKRTGRKTGPREDANETTPCNAKKTNITNFLTKLVNPVEFDDHN